LCPTPAGSGAGRTALLAGLWGERDACLQPCFFPAVKQREVVTGWLHADIGHHPLAC